MTEQEEFELKKRAAELESKLDKQDAQRQMAWTSIVVLILVTFLLFTPVIDEKRIDSIAPMMDWFYIAMASIVGAYMGMTAWMSKR